MKVLFAVDEATAIVDRRNDVGRHLSPMARQATLVRGSEIALMLGYHTPCNVSDIVRSNSYITTSASLTNGHDVWAVKDAAFLTEGQAAALTHLPTGVAMMKLAGRYTHPFLITCDAIPKGDPLSLEEIETNNARILASLPAVAGEQYTQRTGVTPEAGATADDQPKDDKGAILADLRDRAFLNVTDRTRSIRLPSGLTGHRPVHPLMLELKADGFCDELGIQVKSGRKSEKFWYLTERGYGAVGSPMSGKRGGTGPAHFFMQQFVRKVLDDRGVQSEIEALI